MDKYICIDIPTKETIERNRKCFDAVLKIEKLNIGSIYTTKLYQKTGADKFKTFYDVYDLDGDFLCAMLLTFFNKYFISLAEHRQQILEGILNG